MSIGPYISEEFYADGYARPGAMQELWALGWRHFGRHFFRYSLTIYSGEIQTIIPLRIDLQEFKFSKSQRRLLRKNADLRVAISPAEITPSLGALFDRHRGRFRESVPESLRDFLSENPSLDPCQCSMIQCHMDNVCIAGSYLDVDGDAVSSVYGMFEPEQATRGLGIFTMLIEIQWAIQQGKRWYYPGYATKEPSHYDYKKRFSGLQGFDWVSGEWIPLAEMSIAAPKNELNIEMDDQIV